MVIVITSSLIASLIASLMRYSQPPLFSVALVDGAWQGMCPGET
jgi:hypothetical protein